MNLQQIGYVIAVSELRNFSLAAEKCHITQSTLSTMIGKLEDELEIKIFDRKTKPIAVTEEGEEIICQLKIIVAEADNLNELTHALKGEVSSDLRIGVIPTVAPYLLPLFLTDFVSKFPKAHFAINEQSSNELIDTIRKRELDIGILAIPYEDPDFIEIPLYDESFVLYDPENKSSSVDVENIDLHRLWLLEEGHCLRTQVRRICDIDNRKHQQYSNLFYKTGTIYSLTKFVRINNGVTLLPYLATLDFPKDERKKLVTFQEPIPARTIGLIVHKHFVKRRLLESLRSEIQDKVIPFLKENHLKKNIISPVQF